jgi:hypothetical protein
VISLTNSKNETKKILKNEKNEKINIIIFLFNMKNDFFEFKKDIMLSLTVKNKNNFFVFCK